MILLMRYLKVVKFTETVVCWGAGRNGELLFNGYMVLVLQDEKGYGELFTTMNMLNTTLYT